MDEPYRAVIRDKRHVDDSGRATAVISGLSLELPVNAFTVMIGPSGCGKTSTLRILMNLDDAFEGTIDPRLRTARVGAAFQEPRLLPWRTVAQNVALALPPEGRDAIVRAALGDVDLEGYGDRYPAQLSLGQARRAALARAFAVRPDVLFLDEPFVSLDEASAQRLRRLLLDLWMRHPVTVLMVTHNVREAVQLADRIVLLTERPARVAATVTVPVDRDARDTDAVEGFAKALAVEYPGLVTI